MKEINGEQKTRLFYLDNLKVFLTMLVIVHHVGQAYGPTGGFWPYVSSIHENIPWLGSFFRVNAAFFMGLFFMISGYFLPTSFDRKGSSAIKDKLRRYGIPVLFGFLVMSPLDMYFYYSHYSGNKPLGFIGYFFNIYLGIGGRPAGFKSATGRFPEMNFGHLWFVEDLLVFTLVYFIIYILIRKFFNKDRIKENGKFFGFKQIILISALIAFATAVVRLWYPIDKWVAILKLIQAEPAHLPQYLILFTVGIIAYRKNWFSKISKMTGYNSMVIGIAMAFFVYFRNYIPMEIRKMVFSNLDWAVYESFMAVFLCWGLIVFFREKMNYTSKIIKYLSENSYAAYIFQMPIILTVQFSLDKINIFGAWGKFLSVSLLSLVITYYVSSIIRKVQFIKRVL